MRSKKPPQSLQSPTSLVPCITFGKAKFIPLAGILVQSCKEKYETPRPPSNYSRYIPVYHDDEVAYQLKITPHSAHPSMYKCSPSPASTEGTEEELEETGETGQRSEENSARQGSRQTPPASPPTSSARLYATWAQSTQERLEIKSELEWEQPIPEPPETEQEIEVPLSCVREPRKRQKLSKQYCFALQRVEVDLPPADRPCRKIPNVRKSSHEWQRKLYLPSLELGGGPYNTRRRARALRRFNIVPSPEPPDESFNLLRLPTELRLLVYDMVVTSQTFMVTSQRARGSTFTNLAYTCRKLKGEIEYWAASRPDLTRALRGGFVDFKNTTFLVDYWKDRCITPAKTINPRFQHLSKEKICVEQMRDLCIDIRTASDADGRNVVIEFIRSMYDSLHRFIRLQKMTVVYDSGDDNMGDWYLQKGFGWKGHYDVKEGFLRTVWRMLPSALGVCHWSWPCTCCAPSWKIEIKGFDVRLNQWVELPIEREMYAFAMAA